MPLEIFNRFFLITLFSLIAAPTHAQFDALTCAPYIHGEEKKSVPTFFCAKREDAEAYIDLMEKRRLNQITRTEGQKLLKQLSDTRECFHITTSHTSRKTLHQGADFAPHCKELGLKATKWPSLIEAELSGDQSKIWILTHAIVPPVKN